ncbi:MAG: hypothetical protein V1834_00665, partial [Candidatus Micrarchaeota archaeon]
FFPPTFEGSVEKTFGEQGLLLWALSKAASKGYETQWLADRIYEKLAKNVGEHGIFAKPCSQTFIPMDAALCLNGFIEYYSLREKGLEEATKIAYSLKDNSKGMVYFTKDGDAARSRVSFNNIVYPLHALSRFFKATEDPKIHAKIQKTLAELLASQGQDGQWWWTFDTEGRVVQKYPVYSVHQTAMAPMALKEAADCVPSMQAEAGAAIEKGLKWVWGANELKQSMFDEKHLVFWRSVRPPNWLRKLRQFTMLAPETMLMIDKETRSYHYGWSLYSQSL